MHRQIAFGTAVSLILATTLATLVEAPRARADRRPAAGPGAAAVGADDPAAPRAEEELLSFLLESAAGRRFATPEAAGAWWGEVRAARAGLRRVLAENELEPGALVQYYGNLELRGVPLVIDRQPEIRIEAHNGPYPGVPVDFSSRWFSRLEVPAGGPHAFSLWIDDGARIWIDGRLVLDEWAYTHAWRQLGPIELTKGHHDVIVEHFDSAGPASIYFTWKTPGAAGFELVPWELFHVPVGLEAAVKRLHAALAPAAPSPLTPFEALSGVR